MGFITQVDYTRQVKQGPGESHTLSGSTTILGNLDVYGSILSGGTNLLDIFIGGTDTHVTGGTYNVGTTALDYSGNNGFTPFSINVSDLKDSLWTAGTGTDIYYNLGSVGIGEITPDAILHVVGAGASSATDALIIEDSGFNSLFHVRDDGYVGIGINAPTRNLEINSVDNSSNGIIVNSDSNLADTLSSITLNVDGAGSSRGGSMFYGSDAYAGNGGSFTDPDGYLANTLTITTGGNARGSVNVGTRDDGKPIRLFSGQGTGTGALDDGNLGMIISGTTSGNPVRIIMPNLPTAAAGLPSGALWNNGGVINIV